MIIKYFNLYTVGGSAFSWNEDLVSLRRTCLTEEDFPVSDLDYYSMSTADYISEREEK